MQTDIFEIINFKTFQVIEVEIELPNDFCKADNIVKKKYGKDCIAFRGRVDAKLAKKKYVPPAVGSFLK